MRILAAEEQGSGRITRSNLSSVAERAHICQARHNHIVCDVRCSRIFKACFWLGRLQRRFQIDPCGVFAIDDCSGGKLRFRAVAEVTWLYDLLASRAPLSNVHMLKQLPGFSMAWAFRWSNDRRLRQLSNVSSRIWSTVE